MRPARPGSLRAQFGLALSTGLGVALALNPVWWAVAALWTLQDAARRRPRYPSPVPDHLTDMFRATGGRWEATCGSCVRPSIPIPAVDAALAWAELVKLGWTLNDRPGQRRYALCKKCTAERGTIEDAVKEAHKSRKKKAARDR